MKRSLRDISEPFIVAPPTGAGIRDRLRVTEEDARVLCLVGEHLGRLAGRDLAARIALGAGAKHTNRTERKRALTGESSSRWAGAITRTTADQWYRALLNLRDERAGLTATIRQITRRLDAPVGGRDGRVRGYATRAERWAKQQRRAKLQARLECVQERIRAGRVSVVRGGRRLANTRHNLAAAALTENRWRARWEAKRLFLTADGDAAVPWGNGTIRVHPDDGWVEVRLPTPLAHLSNTPGRAPTYRLSCRVSFNYRRDAWAAQAATGAVRYDITHDPERDRWYIDASWSSQPTELPSLGELRKYRTLGVDLNADHLACWVIDPDGNPVGPAHVIPFTLEGDTARRDGLLRAAISAILRIARENDCRSITIENLNFIDSRQTGRETMGRGARGKRFRRTVSGLPTARFRDRLVGMARNTGFVVIAVDPAYTSQWGAQHWQAGLNKSHRKKHTRRVSRHEAAAVVIGRRGLGYRAQRRTEKTRRLQRKPTGKPSSRLRALPKAVRNTRPGKEHAHQQMLAKTRTAKPVKRVDQAAQNRSGPPAGAGLTPALCSGTV